MNGGRGRVETKNFLSSRPWPPRPQTEEKNSFSFFLSLWNSHPRARSLTHKHTKQNSLSFPLVPLYTHITEKNKTHRAEKNKTHRAEKNKTHRAEKNKTLKTGFFEKKPLPLIALPIRSPQIAAQCRALRLLQKKQQKKERKREKNGFDSRDLIHLVSSLPPPNKKKESPIRGSNRGLVIPHVYQWEGAFKSHTHYQLC